MRVLSVSVITPSLNQAQFIEENILSVKNQGISFLEHIIVDGGSVDGTIDVLKQYQDQYPLKWTSEPDQGQSDAINKGFRRATGDIIGWVNSDDTYVPGAILTAINFLASNPNIYWVFGDAFWIDAEGRVLGVYKGQALELKQLLYKGMYIPQPTIFFRRLVFEKIGYCDESLHYTMDYDFALRLALNYQGAYLAHPLATRRLHQDAKSINQNIGFIEDGIRTIEKFFENSSLPLDIRRFQSKVLSRRYLVSSYRAFSSKDYPKTRNLIWKSLELHPGSLVGRDGINLLATLLQSYLRVAWISPGYSRRKADKIARSKLRNAVVSWKKQIFPPVT